MSNSSESWQRGQIDSSGQSVPTHLVARVAPASWLAPAIVATLCCFSPTGVVAVYYSAQVNTYWNLGNSQAAAVASKKARRWVIISVLLWVIAMIFLIATGRMGALFESGALSGG